MRVFRPAVAIAFAAILTTAHGLAASAIPGTDPLAAIDLNRNAIIADIVRGFEGDRAALAKRLAALRADRLLSASLASTRESLESILAESEKSRGAANVRARSKTFGDAYADLVYTPIAPCRLVDTRGFGAPIQGGAFAPNERRSYAPNGLCGLPVDNVATLLISFTTQNLTPTSGGYLAILPPNGPVTTTVDIFNFNSEWSASNTAVGTDPAAQFDVFVSTASAHLVVDILGYFMPPQGGAVTSITAGTGLTGGTITDNGTIAIAGAYQLPQTCTNGQVAQSNGAGAWSCVTIPPAVGAVTAVTASAPLASSGGTTPNITLPGGTVGEVLVGTASAPVWSSSPSLGGNLLLVDSTPTAGNIMKGADTFIHNRGLNNTFVGKGAGNLTMAGVGNTASGSLALSANTTGDFNTAHGDRALASNTTGADNTGIGVIALFANTVGNFNTALGHSALATNSSGTDNTALGAFSLRDNTTGNANTAVGRSALFANTTGISNTASGFNVLVVNTTGSNNTATGANTMLSNTSGDGNSAFGSAVLQANTTGYSNSAFGSGSVVSNTTGFSNTAIGASALQGNTTGAFNTAIGSNALQSNSTGNTNIALGINAGINLTTGDANIAIGHPGVAGENATTRIGFFQTRTFVTGVRGVTTDVANAIPVLIDGSGQLGTVSSSRRFKDDIADMDAASSALLKLRPVTFHYTSDRNPSGRSLQYGLIAEEVASVYPGLVAHSADGQVETVMYQYLPPMLLNEHQKLARTVEAQAARIDAQAREIAELRQLSARMALALERLAPVNVARQ